MHHLCVISLYDELWQNIWAHPAYVRGNPGQHLLEGEVEVKNAEQVIISQPVHHLLLDLWQILI